MNQVRGVYCYRSERAAVIAALGFEKLFGFLDGNETPTIFQAEVRSAQMRESDPTVMDVDYIVYSDSPTVNVRCLAFEDGERGFATVVRPETFIEGTDANLGDGIAANVVHRLSWKVSSDWATDLAKVKFEVMAMEPGALLLPMHFVTIPAAEGHPKTIVSVNDLSSKSHYVRYYTSYIPLSWNGGLVYLSHENIIDALLWCYADAQDDLLIEGGILKTGQIELARHDALCDPYVSGWSSAKNADRYVFQKMGYRLLEDDDELIWINENTRLNLRPGTRDRKNSPQEEIRQYAVKTVEE